MSVRHDAGVLMYQYQAWSSNSKQTLKMTVHVLILSCAWSWRTLAVWSGIGSNTLPFHSGWNSLFKLKAVWCLCLCCWLQPPPTLHYPLLFFHGISVKTKHWIAWINFYYRHFQYCVMQLQWATKQLYVGSHFVNILDHNSLCLFWKNISCSCNTRMVGLGLFSNS